MIVGLKSFTVVITFRSATGNKADINDFIKFLDDTIDFDVDFKLGESNIHEISITGQEYSGTAFFARMVRSVSTIRPTWFRILSATLKPGEDDES